MRNLSDKKGITLVELIVSLGVLAIVITPLFSLFYTSQIISNQSEKEFRTIELAQQCMEEIKSSNGTLVGYTSDADDKITRTVAETDSTYAVDISITPANKLLDVADDTTVYDLELTVDENSKNPVNSWANGSTIRMDMGTANIELYDELNPDKSRKTIDLQITKQTKIKITVKKLVTFNVNNKSGQKIAIDIYNVDKNDKKYDCNLNVISGEIIQKSNNKFEQVTQMSNNILYNVEIFVRKNGEVVNTLTGSKIFKYKPIVQ